MFRGAASSRAGPGDHGSHALQQYPGVNLIETPHGPARVTLHESPGARCGLILGHGAGGGIAAGDLVAARDAALGLGITVALVEQPYRVAGRRSPPPPAQLDGAWLCVTEWLRRDILRDRQLICGGRSSGARVACRAAGRAGAAAVLCLAFPLHPPGRPDRTRLPELDGVEVPVLVVQGQRDPFGVPPPGPSRRVATVSGDHSLRAVGAVRQIVAAWLAELIG